jgi:misacylated tRNA(Ala) deacylase
METTTRLYLQDSYCFETDAKVLAVQGNVLAFDQTCFYPGGGGQPADEGTATSPNGNKLEIISAYTDQDEIIWHVCTSPPSLDLVGNPIHLSLNTERRLALMRHHTVLHVLNTIVLRDYAGWITGVQIGTDYSRIDFKLENFPSALVPELEDKVNAVLAGNHSLKSYTIPEGDFRQRDDLLRTLEAKPPVMHGLVRVVEIDGFDAQACGGTHVHNTAEVGTFSIFRTDNKGRINKRFYVKLEPLKRN